MDDGGPIFTRADAEGASPREPARSWLSRSYIGRHWRGDLGLAVSYWVNIVVVGGAVGILSLVIGEGSALWATSAARTVAAIVGMWAALLAVIVWQLVGTWRSAERHEGRGGTKFWAGVARVMVALIALQNGGLLVTSGIPQLRDAYDIATGDIDMGVAVLRPLNDGKELEVFGGITFGLTDKVAKQAETLPALRTIHLTSTGGRVTEAEQLRAYIRDRGYDTYVPTECSSACVTVFLGGVRRFVNPDAKVGFHAHSVAGQDARDARAIEREAVADAVKWGVEPAFANRAFHVKPEDMWYPELSEVVAAGVATGVSDGQFAFSGLAAVPDRDSVVEFLKSDQEYAALADAHPEVFEALVDLFLDAARNGKPENDLYIASANMVHDLYAARLAAAPDALLLRWAALQTSIIKAIIQAQPEACEAAVTASGADSKAAFDRPETLWQREQDIRLEVLRHGANVAAVTEAQATEVSDTFWRVVEERHGAAVVPMIERLNIEAEPSAESCKAALILYETVARMRPDQGAMLLRWMVVPPDDPA